MEHSSHLAYIVGVALGDGNLSSPNGRATRLRITCDSTYPNIANEIVTTLRYLFPKNKVAIVSEKKLSYFNISLYSNTLDEVIPWKVGCGSKEAQDAHVPEWIMKDNVYSSACLRGLIQTDGSIYYDRGYRMVNFTNINKSLADQVCTMIQKLGYEPRQYSSLQRNGKRKHVVRLAKKVDTFLEEVRLTKA